MNILNKIGKDLLLDLLNRDNGTAFTFNDVVFSNPQVIVNPTTFRNTKVAINAKVGGQYVGSKVVDYHRIDIAHLLKPQYRRVIGVGVTISTDLIPILNTRFGLQLEVSDIVAEPIDTSAMPVTYRLKFQPNCYAFIGQVDLELINDLPDLEELITVNLLDGFHYPSDPVISTAAPEYVTQAGHLLVGADIEGDKMTLGVNDEVEVFVGAHHTNVGTFGMTTPVSDVYQIDLGVSDHWALTFGSALREEGRGNDLVMLYDLKLKITLDNGAEIPDSLELTLKKDGDNRLVWDCTAGLPDIDGSATQQRYLIQTSINAATLATAFPSAVKNSVGAPEGNYTVVVSASAKNAIYVNDIHYSVQIQINRMQA